MCFCAVAGIRSGRARIESDQSVQGGGRSPTGLSATSDRSVASGARRRKPAPEPWVRVGAGPAPTAQRSAPVPTIVWGIHLDEPTKVHVVGVFARLMSPAAVRPSGAPPANAGATRNGARMVAAKELTQHTSLDP